jgi:GAF domain-containing protein/HAMP domain-containing protein
MFRVETQEADRRSRPTRRWRIAHKLTIASVLMIMLTLLAGGVGLWQVLTIGQAIGEAREKEQQLVRSLELLGAGDRLVAALDHMFLTQDSDLMSTDVPVSLGVLKYYMETLQKAGGETEGSDLLGEMQVAYSELRQAVREVDVLARQELWTEVGVALEREVGPANERMGLLTRQLVHQADKDVAAMAARTQVVVRRAALLLAVLMVLTTAVALGWRQFVFRGLSLSISELRQGVARISSGGLDYKLDVRTGDEIEELGDEFNKMADELANVIGSLEQRVADRTRGLQTAAEVARATTSVLDPDELLRQIVDLVCERFNLYYVGLFLLDEERRFAALRAGTGEAGQQMLAQGHRLEVGGESMIGWCVANAEARIALDVGEEAVRFDNPLLPYTRSEMSLPLRSRGRVIGAMTVQSVEEAAFDEADIAVMQTMADQVAVAIDNALLFVETQAALEEVEATHRRYLSQAWTGYLQMAKATSYETERPGVAPLGDAVLPEIQQAVERQSATVLTGPSTLRQAQDVAGSGQGDEGDGEGHSALVAPIALRGEVIGAFGIHDEDGAREWTDEDLALAEAIAEQLALAADNLRLLDETQRRAAHERLTGEVTARVRETLDMETVLQTAVREISKALGLAALDVRLGAEELTGGDRSNHKP